MQTEGRKHHHINETSNAYYTIDTDDNQLAKYPQGYPPTGATTTTANAAGQRPPGGLLHDVMLLCTYIHTLLTLVMPITAVDTDYNAFQNPWIKNNNLCFKGRYLVTEMTKCVF